MEVMRPMSSRSRRALALWAFFAFIILVPLAILYVNGYRLTFTDKSGGTSFTSTGAIVLDSLVPGSKVYVDGVFYANTPDIFSQSLFIEDMSPGIHAVDIVASGTVPWRRNLLVVPRYVARASAFILNDPVVVTKVIAEDPTAATSTRIVQVPLDQYENMRAQFASSSLSTFATSTDSAIVRDNVALWLENSHTIGIEWRGNSARIPHFFCSIVAGHNICPTRVYIPVRSVVRSVEFFPGRTDIILLLTANSLVAIEVDGRSDRTLIPLFTGGNLEFRTVAGSLYVKQGSSIFYLHL